MMLDAVINNVVRLTITTTPEQLERLLASLPHGVRFGVIRDLEQTGRAHRFENARHCAYYLKRQRPGVMVWRWCYVVSEREATRLRMCIESLEVPLNLHRANRVYETATGRSVGNPRPPNIEFHAAHSGDYPALRVSGVRASEHDSIPGTLQQP
jgi:hypothetical protein